MLTPPPLELGGGGNAEATRFRNEHASPPIVARGRSRIMTFLDGLEPLPPGLVSCARRRPEPNTEDGKAEVARFGVVAREP